jgi:hypothetical protein
MQSATSDFLTPRSAQPAAAANDQPSPWKVSADRERAAQAETLLARRRELVLRTSSGSLRAPPANDNQAWPLLAQLRKDGNDVLVAVAERYRAIYDAASATVPLVGTVLDDTFLPLVQKTANKTDPDARAKGALVIGGAPPVGDGCFRAGIETEELADARRANNLKNPPRRARRPVAKKWNGDRFVIAAIDARRELKALRSALGPLVEPFEDAVLHGKTLTEIGLDQGAGDKTAGAVGKAFVLKGLSTVMEGLSAVQQALGAARQSADQLTPD